MKEVTYSTGFRMLSPRSGGKSLECHHLELMGKETNESGSQNMEGELKQTCQDLVEDIGVCGRYELGLEAGSGLYWVG